METARHGGNSPLHYLADGILENEISVAPEKCLRPQEQWWLERHQQIFDRTERSLIELKKAIDSLVKN